MLTDSLNDSQINDSLTYSFVHWFTKLLTRSLIHMPTDSLNDSHTNWFALLFTNNNNVIHKKKVFAPF